MNKQEATKIMQDILGIWTDETRIHSYSIDKTKDSYEIRIFLSAYLRKIDLESFGPIIKKHGLAVKELENSLVIYDPTKTCHFAEAKTLQNSLEVFQ